MKISKLVVLVFIMVIFGGAVLVVTMIQNKKPKITGRYITARDIAPQKIGITLKIMRHGNEINEYRTKLKKDGSFSVRVEERGLYDVLIFMFSYEPQQLSAPIVSNEFNPHPCRLEEGQVVNIGTHYLLDALKIISPLYESSYLKPNELTLEWEEVPFANFYELVIYKVSDTDKHKYERMATSYLLDTKISYNDLQALEIRKIEDIQFQEFNTFFQNFVPGCYAISVSAYKYDTDNNKTVFVCTNGNLEKTQFNIGN